MLGTLVQIAREMLQYEANNKKIPVEKLELNRLCWDLRKKGKEVPRVATLVLDDGTVRLEDYKEDERYRYLYALSTGKQSRGPTWLINFSKKGKTQSKIIESGLKQVKTGLSLLRDGLSKSDSEWAEKALNLLQRNEKIIAKSLSNISSQRFLITIEFHKKKAGDLSSVARAFLERRLLASERAQYSGQGQCAVCGGKATVRPSLPFDKFFTVEKRGFAPMGFEFHSWKYTPLCVDCTKWLFIAQSFLNRHLRTRVAGTPAYLIPTLEPGASTIKGSFIQYLWEFSERSQDRVTPRVEDIPEGISNDQENEEEDERSPNLMRDLVEREDYPPFLSLSLIFHQQAGQKFLFLRSTPDILPNNLAAVKETLRQLRSLLTNNALGSLGKSKVTILSPDFNFLSYAWSWPKGRSEKKKSSGTLKLDPMLLAEAIILRKPPVESIFWSDVDSLLRAHFKKAISGGDQFTARQVLSNQVALIWAIWNLLYQTNKGEHPMNKEPTTMETGMKELSPNFWEGFFAPKRMLDESDKRALFLIGVLFGRVESMQRRERRMRATGEMPILGRLRGLTISYREMTSQLFPELKYKLRQLRGWTRVAREIEAAAAKYLAESEPTSDSEARFYFSLGWSLEWDTYMSVRGTLGLKEEEEEEIEELETEPTSEEQ
jgi:hypothetical protein